MYARKRIYHGYLVRPFDGFFYPHLILMNDSWLNIILWRLFSPHFVFSIVVNRNLNLFSGVLMFWHLTQYYIVQRYLQTRDDIAPDFRFPYCVLLYTIAFLLTLVVCVMYNFEQRRQTNYSNLTASMNESQSIVLTEPEEVTDRNVS